jgi:hypothetical protein
MADLKDKIQNALDESRILILGAQVLIGFELRAIFEEGFNSLSVADQYIKLIALGFMLIALALLMSPASYHRIVEHGKDTSSFHELISDVIKISLVPFALGFSLDLFIAADKIASRAFAIGFAVTTALMAAFFWYGLTLFHTKRHRPEHERIGSEQADMNSNNADSPPLRLRDKIQHVLSEARMVLPGAQALLGFQFSIILLNSFDKLPQELKYLHLASLATITLSVILLMTPASYHRIVERGEDSDHFYKFASKMTLASMVTLALGISSDIFVVIYQVTKSMIAAWIFSLLALILFYGCWFIYAFYCRSRKERSSHINRGNWRIASESKH